MTTMPPTQTAFHQATTASSAATSTCTTAVPDKYGYVPPDSCNANYGFYPQWEDNTAFAVAFGLSTVVHLVQAVLLKKVCCLFYVFRSLRPVELMPFEPFCWVIVMGASWECICFTLRALGARDQQEMTYVIVSTLLFLLAPLWINAFAYMIVARLVHFLHPQRSMMGISAQWLAKGFVTGDVICFVIQAAGGAMIADQNSEDNAELGRKVYMAGVSVQLALVVTFLVLHAFFHRDLVQNSRIGKSRARNGWTKVLVWVIYIVLVLIMIRIIFRLIEFSQGVSSSNVILRHEEFPLYLDALPMLVAVFLLNFVHPGMVLAGPESAFPAIQVKWWHREVTTAEALPLSSFDRA
ncbi:hypothetical protein ACJZ2D_010339 [Fusarium nematophilum]